MRAKRKFDRFTAGLQALALLMLLPTVCHAGGFALNEWSARANAMGGANIALADDASAVAYNPAGITQLPGTQTMIGATLIVPKAQVTVGAQDPAMTKTNYYLPPHAYLTHQVTDRVWIGLGMYTRFGVGTQYPQDWAGRSNTYLADLATYSIAPNFAFKATDKLSIAFGPEIMYSSADLRKMAFGATKDMQMKVDGVGIGGQLALHYKFDDQWSAGFTYHTPQKHIDSGRVHYNGEAGNYRDSSMDISLTLPASYSLGVAYKPTSKWKLEVDAIYTQWQDYEKITYSYSVSPLTGAAGDIVSDKNWKNVWRFQLGGEYMATDWLALRAGYVWDQDPVRKGYEDYMLPSSDRMIYSTGFGIINGPFTYDFSLMYLMNKDRSIEANPGNNGYSTFKDSRAYMAGISVGYKF